MEKSQVTGLKEKTHSDALKCGTCQVFRRAISHNTSLKRLNLCTCVHNIMYFEPLTKTSVEILVYLSSKIRESFTVRQIAEAIRKDYKISHTMTLRLATQQYITAEKK